MKPFLSLMLAAGAGCVIVIWASGSRAQEQEQKWFNLELTETIQGACIVSTTDNLHVTLDNPTVRVLGDRVFLVGPQIDDDEKRDITNIQFGTDAALWIPIDSITVIGQIPMDE